MTSPAKLPSAVKADESVTQYPAKETRSVAVEAPLSSRSAALDPVDIFRIGFLDSLIPLYIFDQETLRFLDVNDATVTQYGFTREELLQLCVTELQPNEEVARLVTFLYEMVPSLLANDGMEKWHMCGYWRHRRKSGALVDVSLAIHGVVFAGRPAIAASAFDMTEILRADATLRYSTELVYQLTDNLDAVFWVATPDLSRFLYISAAYEKVWGRSRSYLYANAWSSLEAIHPEDLPRVEAATRNSFVHFNEEYRIIRPDGEVRWIHGRAFPIQNPTGEIIRVAGIAEDITEQKSAADRLRYSEEQLRQLTENITEVFWITSADGERTLYLSPAYEKIWGRSIASAYEEPWSFTEAIHPDDRPRVLPELHRPWTSDRGPLEHEYRVLQPTGGIVWIRERIFPVKDENGEVSRLVGISEDISVQKHAQEALDNVSRQLIEAQEAERRHFAGELHDEIGQTLTALKINIEAVLQDTLPHLQARLRESVQMIDATVEQVRNLCVDLRPSQLDDLGLLPTLSWYVDRQAQRTGLRIHLTTAAFPRQIPTIETTCFRIVQEALTNVVRHGQTQDVWIELLQRGTNIELVICDHGVGFDMELVRLRSLQGRSSGILGMEKRVRLAGGRFEIKTQPQQGVRIAVVLPCQGQTKTSENQRPAVVLNDNSKAKRRKAGRRRGGVETEARQ